MKSCNDGPSGSATRLDENLTRDIRDVKVIIFLQNIYITQQLQRTNAV